MGIHFLEKMYNSIPKLNINRSKSILEKFILQIDKYINEILSESESVIDTKIILDDQKLKIIYQIRCKIAIIPIVDVTDPDNIFERQIGEHEIDEFDNYISDKSKIVRKNIIKEYIFNVKLVSYESDTFIYDILKLVSKYNDCNITFMTIYNKQNNEYLLMDSDGHPFIECSKFRIGFSDGHDPIIKIRDELSQNYDEMVNFYEKWIKYDDEYSDE